MNATNQSPRSFMEFLSSEIVRLETVPGSEALKLKEAYKKHFLWRMANQAKRPSTLLQTTGWKQ